MKSYLFTHLNGSSGVSKYTVILAVSAKEAWRTFDRLCGGEYVVRTILSYADFNNMEPDGHNAEHLTDFIKQLK